MEKLQEFPFIQVGMGIATVSFFWMGLGFPVGARRGSHAGRRVLRSGAGFFLGGIVLVMVWAMTRSLEEGLGWGFIGGLLVDLLSGGPLGGTSLALVLAAFLAGQSWGQGIGSSTVRTVLLAILGTTAFHLTLLIVLAWTFFVPIFYKGPKDVVYES